DEARGAERVGFVEDLVTDAAALGQAAFGKLHAQPRDLVLWHHDDGAVVADFEGDRLAFEVLDDGGRVFEAEVGKQGGHLRGGDAHDHEREEADQGGCHRDHRRQSRSTQPPQEAYETLQTNRPSDSAPGNLVVPRFRHSRPTATRRECWNRTTGQLLPMGWFRYG